MDNGDSIMPLIQLALLGIVTITALWIFMVLLPTLLYGAACAATGASAYAMATCVDAPTLFLIEGAAIDLPTLLSFGLLIATWHLVGKVFTAGAAAFARLRHPFTPTV